MDICWTLSLGWISYKILSIHVSASAYTRKTQVLYFNGAHLQRCTNIAIRTLKWNLGDDFKIVRVPGSKKNSVNNTVWVRLHLPGVILWDITFYARQSLIWRYNLQEGFRIVCHLCFFFQLTYRFWGQVTHSICNLPSKLHQLLWR